MESDQNEWIADVGKVDPWKVEFKPLDRKIKRKDKALAKSVHDTELERLSQSNSLRPWFMAISLTLAGIIVITSAFVVIWLTVREQLTDPLGVGFTVTLGIEVLGIVGIIAHYLFAVPDSHLLKNSETSKGD